jgi:hypothetical protein
LETREFCALKEWQIRAHCVSTFSSVSFPHGLFSFDEHSVSSRELCVQRFLFSCCDYLSGVIVLGMGSAKKKPMTKKEREERRRRHKEKRLKK